MEWNGTWASVADALYDAKVSCTATEAVRRATAQSRHLCRMNAAYMAALEWLSYAFRSDSDLAMHAYALCFAESIGLYGGGTREPGAGTTRHPAFRGLGTGRRRAADGTAWTAAIAAVAADVGAHFAVDPDGRLAVGLYKDGGTKVFVPVGALLADEPEARYNFSLHAARAGWNRGDMPLIIAAAKELDAAAEKEVDATATAVAEDDGDWTEVEDV